jgi:hypothetical protein
MKRTEAIALIDAHKNELINPVDMLHWTWLRVIINNFTEGEWETAVEKAVETMSK